MLWYTGWINNLHWRFMKLVSLQSITRATKLSGDSLAQTGLCVVFCGLFVVFGQVFKQELKLPVVTYHIKTF